jgi:hypothetical protein
MPHLVGGEAVEDQDAGGEQGCPADAEPAVGDDVGAVAEPSGESLDVGQDGGRVGNAAVGDRDGHELHACVVGCLGFVGEVDLVEFGRGECADEDVDAGGV